MFYIYPFISLSVAVTGCTDCKPVTSIRSPSPSRVGPLRALFQLSWCCARLDLSPKTIRTLFLISNVCVCVQCRPRLCVVACYCSREPLCNSDWITTWLRSQLRLVPSSSLNHWIIDGMQTSVHWKLCRVVSIPSAESECTEHLAPVLQPPVIYVAVGIGSFKEEELHCIGLPYILVQARPWWFMVALDGGGVTTFFI